MDKTKLLEILTEVKEGHLEIGDALAGINGWPTSTIDCANLDRHRGMRTGIPEVIFGENKEAAQIIEIARQMVGHPDVIMATRVDATKAKVVCAAVPELSYHVGARMLIGNCPLSDDDDSRGVILVVSAGTSDMPVAEEAFHTASALGHRVEKIYDVGVAGIHRLFAHRDILQSAEVLIVVAGMEGALPSVVAGLVAQPVIAVPTSVGYGTGFGGVAALLAMLNSCAPGVAVVNIDNGFGAACMAVAINRKRNSGGGSTA